MSCYFAVRSTRKNAALGGILLSLPYSEASETRLRPYARRIPYAFSSHIAKAIRETYRCLTAQTSCRS
jgi:hypothetical protein